MKLPRTAGLAGEEHTAAPAAAMNKTGSAGEERRAAPPVAGRNPEIAEEEHTAAPAVAEQRVVFVGPPHIAAIAGLGVVEIGSGRGIAGPVDFHSDRQSPPLSLIRV
jgi:hypothetical protein